MATDPLGVVLQNAAQTNVQLRVLSGACMASLLPFQSPSYRPSLIAPQVSSFVFEFNAADKVSHLGQTYTWYGINGVQYNASQVMRRQELLPVGPKRGGTNRTNCNDSGPLGRGLEFYLNLFLLCLHA